MILISIGGNLKNHIDLEKFSYFKQSMTLILVFIKTALMMPALDLILKATVHVTVMSSASSNNSSASSSSDELTIRLVTYLVCALGFTSLSMLALYSMRILQLFVPCDGLVPWSAPNSRVVYLNFVLKVLLVAANIFDLEGSFV